MSLAKINNFANDDTDILAVQSTVDALYNNSYSLTNYDNTTVPAIAAGSKIEVNGSLYRAATEEAISTTDPVTSSTVADGTVYICMIPSGDASTCTAAFTATAPTWSDSKQGWYGTGGQANYKYIGGCGKSTTYYFEKFVYAGFKKSFLINYHIKGDATERTIQSSDTSYTTDTNLTLSFYALPTTYYDISLMMSFKTNGGNALYYISLISGSGILYTSSSDDSKNTTQTSYVGGSFDSKYYSQSGGSVSFRMLARTQWTGSAYPILSYKDRFMMAKIIN